MATRRLVAMLCLLPRVVLLSGCVALDSSSSDGDDPDPEVEAVFEGAFVHSDGFEDELFAFEPPENATVERL